MAAVTVVMSGDDAKLRAAHERLLAQQQKLLDKYANAMNKSEESSKKAVSGVDAMGNAMVGAAAKYATAAGLMTLAVGGVRKAWDLVTVSQERAMAAMQGGLDPNIQLLQVATSGTDFDALQKKADDIANKAGMARNTAKKVMFEARSQGFESDAAELAGYHQVFGDMDTATSIAGKVPKMFPKEKLSAIKATNQMMSAAGTSPEDFKRLAEAFNVTAAAGGISGSSSNETMASLAILASQFKSGITAADRLAMFGIKAGVDKDLAGLGTTAAFKKLQAGPEATREEFLGDSSELRVAYATLEKVLPDIEKETARLDAEGKRFDAGGGVLREKKSIADANTEMTAIRKKNRAESGLEAATIGAFGEAAGTSAAITANVQARLIGESLPRRMVGGATAGIVGPAAGEVGMSEETGTRIGVGFANAMTGRFFQSGLGPAIADWIRGVDKFNEAAQRLNANNSTTNNARQQAAQATQ